MPVLSESLTATALPGQATVRMRVAVRPSRVRQLRQAGLPVPPPVTTDGLIDTGSFYTLLDATILTALGLTTPTGQATVTTAVGAQISLSRFHVSLSVLHPQPRRNLRLQSAPVLSANLAPLGVRALLGCDVLGRCVLTWDGPANRFILAY